MAKKQARRIHAFETEMRRFEATKIALCYSFRIDFEAANDGLRNATFILGDCSKRIGQPFNIERHFLTKRRITDEVFYVHRRFLNIRLLSSRFSHSIKVYLR